MANNQTRAVSDAVLKADTDALAALKKVENYTPVNEMYSLDNIQGAATALQLSNEKFAQAEAEWKAARDAKVAAQWQFHNAILGSKKQVVAQFGDDAPEVQSVGLKRKSERAKPVRKKVKQPA